MLFNPFLHNQPFANQLGKREKLACFRAKLASCPIASSPSSRHSCFCLRAKPAHDCANQSIIIAISRTGPAASIPHLSSFRAYYELIMSSFPGSPNATSPPPGQIPPTRPIPNASAVQDRAARSNQKPYQSAVLLFLTCPSIKKMRVMAVYQS